MTTTAPIPCPEQRGRKPGSRRTCGWCNRRTAHWRASPGGGFECRDDTCGTKGKPLKRLGVKAVLALVKAHGWNLAAASRSQGLVPHAVVQYLDANAPEEMAEARCAGLIRNGHRRQHYKLTYAEQVRCVLQLHDGNRTQAAKALGVKRDTLVRAMARLCPGEFISATERRRSGQMVAA